MRYLISFLAGGAAVGVLLTEARSGLLSFLVAPLWVHAALYLAPLILIALLVGLFAAPRGALVAFAAYVLGVALWVAFDLRPGPPGTSDVWGYDQWGYFILQMLPSAVISAVVGAIASRLRRSGIGTLRPMSADWPSP
jgi:hypothetical protein